MRLSFQGPTTEANNTFGFTDAVTYVHGRHTWKVGGGISAYQNNTVYDYIVDGLFGFSATDNSGNVLGAGNTSTASFTISSLSASATPHTITAVYGANGNFTTSQGALAGGQTVNRKTLVVNGITAADKVYDATTAATLIFGPITTTGVVAGDNVTVNVAGAVGTFANASVGNAKPVAISGLTLTGPSAGLKSPQRSRPEGGARRSAIPGDIDGIGRGIGICLRRFWGWGRGIWRQSIAAGRW